MNTYIQSSNINIFNLVNRIVQYLLLIKIQVHYFVLK